MFDETIQVSLDDLRDRMRSIHPPCVEMVDEIERLVRSGGKRIRPTFCYMAFRGLGGEHCPEIILAASSLEMLHTFALIHDDIMDRSMMRRGRPSTYSTRPTDAVLIGDLAFALSDSM
ncbi:MAG TPA: polyprenyl synthetase family protein, partial [Actinomycetota bacterium]|nr:polyprenyl synthetase family protein [Actinomycetota bacterium]